MSTTTSQPEESTADEWIEDDIEASLRDDLEAVIQAHYGEHGAAFADVIDALLGVAINEIANEILEVPGDVCPLANALVSIANTQAALEEIG